MARLRPILQRLLAVATLLICSSAALLAQPAISITPTTLNFFQVQGGKFAQASFTISNTGDQTLTGTVKMPGGVFQIVDGDLDFSLAPGGFEVITLRFTPSAVKEFTDSITITHNATAQTSPLYVSLMGTGVEGSVGTADTVEIGISPQSVSFGSVMQGTTAQRVVYITNMSDSAMLVGSVSASTTSPAFLVESGMGAFSLAPGEVRPVTLRFSPSAAVAYDDSLTIVYNGTTQVETASVQLSGTGIALPPVTPSVAVTPEVVFFGNVAVGQSGQRVVTVTNTSGTAQLAGTIGTTSAGSTFSVDNSTGTAFTLAPGMSQTIAVNFAPTAAGVQRDSFMLTFAGIDQPTAIQLVGSGVVVDAGGGNEQVIAIAPSSLNFGNVTVGQTMQQQFTVTNPSTTSPLVLNVTNPVFPFFIQGGAAGSATIAPGESRTYTVSYTPTFAGTFGENLLINYTSGANVGSSFIGLSGTASAVVAGIADEGSSSARAIASFPEPTAAGTTLRYATSASGNVRLTVFDARGREVARLVDGATEAGEHTITWNAEGQAAGVYVVQLVSSDGVATGRVTLVR